MVISQSYHDSPTLDTIFRMDMDEEGGGRGCGGSNLIGLAMDDSPEPRVEGGSYWQCREEKRWSATSLYLRMGKIKGNKMNQYDEKYNL